ncbi:MAG: FG-GAP-like repeat-containing protein [Vulcanimicrobiota bacterium]
MHRKLSCLGLGLAVLICGCGSEDDTFVSGFNLFATGLRISAQPTAGTPNTVLSNLQVQFVNNNQVVPTQGGVSLSLSTNPTNAVLGGTTSGTTNSNGQIDFTNLTISKRGVYRITASAAGVPSVVSNPIVVGGGAVNANKIASIANAGATLGGIFSVHSADLNGDGNLDLVSSFFDDNLIAVYLGNGSGGFAAPINRTVAGAGPQDFTIADFDGDGKADLAIPASLLNTVLFFKGVGDGTFNAPVSVNVGTNPVDAAVGDFNGDGRPDLAVANFNSNNITILLNNNSFAFTASTLNLATGTDRPAGLVVTDINGDGRADLAVADFQNDKMEFYLGNGNGTFGAVNSLASGVSPRDVVAGDLNGDGRADLVTANRDTNNLSVFLNNGAGSFAAAANLASGVNPNKVAMVDLNLDGKLDLINTNSNGGNASIFLGNGDGTFGAPTAQATSTAQPTGLDVGDYNKDSIPDFAIGNFSPFVLDIFQQTP